MIILFDERGHLTDYAIHQLLRADLDELSALEVAEHLAYCDRCLLKYTAAIENTALMAPALPVEQEVLKKIGQQDRRLFFNRYATAAVAACLAMAFWLGGVFTPQIPTDNIDVWATVAESTTVLRESTQDLSNYISQNLSQFFYDIQGFDLKGVFEHEKE